VTADLVVVDTDVASDLFERKTTDDEVLATTALTFVTVGELHRGAEHARWGSRRRGELDAWIAQCAFIPADESVAYRWGQMTGSLLGAGRPLPTNDSWIAACCLRHDLPLATYNRRDFELIDGLRLIPPE
jgi:predicted nucleic acid-binding protein